MLRRISFLKFFILKFICIYKGNNDRGISWKIFVRIMHKFIVRYWLFRFCLFFCFFLSGSFIILQNNTVFWLLFSTLALSIALVVTFSFCSNVTCSIFSSFTIILPIDYWVGSSLKYVMINIVRRATVEDFNLAIVRPPVQTKGIIFFMDTVKIVY